MVHILSYFLERKEKIGIAGDWKQVNFRKGIMAFYLNEKEIDILKKNLGGRYGTDFIGEKIFKTMSNISDTNITYHQPNPNYKYSENEILEDLKRYLDKTYSGHYVKKDGLQALDLMDSLDIVKEYCIGNIIKYSMRYGKKGGKSKDDLMKIIHYTIFLLHFDHYRTEEK